MTRLLLALALLVLAAACSDRDAPRPVPVPEQEPAADAARPLPSRESPTPATGGSAGPAAAALDPDDPAEPGIPDLARLARYVFKAMQRHQEICPFDNPFRDRLHATLQIEVKSGRMAHVGLGHVGLEPEAGGEARTLAERQYPRELTAYVTCLAPHLQTVAMAPSPADGNYEAVYTFAATATGKAAP
jgi:hypothetical protein